MPLFLLCSNLSAPTFLYLAMIIHNGLPVSCSQGHHVQICRSCAAQLWEGGSVSSGHVTDPEVPSMAVQFTLSKASVLASPSTWYNHCRFVSQLAPSCHPVNKYSTKHYSLPGRTSYIIYRAWCKMKIRASYSQIIQNFKMLTAGH